MRMCVTLVGLVAIGYPLSPLTAQDTLPVRPGARLRVTAESALLRLPAGTYRALDDSTMVRSTGLYRELVGATLILAHGSHTLGFPLASIDRVEQSGGRRPSVAGGIVGFLLGGAVGTGLACLTSRDSYGVPCVGDSDAAFLLGISLGGGVGALLGAMAFGREEWREVDVGRLTGR